MAAKDLREFVALAKAKPGALSYGSPGNGTQGQLVAELFKQHAGIDMLHVPYKGASGAVTDLMAGHIESCRPRSPPPRRRSAPAARAALAISAAARLPEYPGHADLRRDRATRTWSPRCGSRSPGRRTCRREIVERLNAEVRRALELPEVRERLQATKASRPTASTRREFTAFVADELQRWGADGARLRREERLSEYPRFSDAEYARRHQALGARDAEARRRPPAGGHRPPRRQRAAMGHRLAGHGRGLRRLQARAST